uniref:HSF-type DNA-binding domain-containing protein n=1 Tax=Haptolina brevifila TaxID=156173 RepID=A0A7S2CLQ5_9EUKA
MTATDDPSTSQVPTPIALIAKTWEMVTAGHEEIGFSDDGMYIIVHNTERCAIHVMPLYFNHKVYASWVRGINACGFHKVPGRDHRWFHEHFHREHPEWLEQIKRRPPPSRGRPGSSTGEGRRRTKAPPAKETAAPSTAIIPHVPLSVADLHPERLRLQQAMAEEAHLERALAEIREGNFWQRFEAVRMMHMMLTRHSAARQEHAKADPAITVLQPALASDATCPLLQLCKSTSALQLCDKTAGPGPAEVKAMVEGVEMTQAEEMVEAMALDDDQSCGSVDDCSRPSDKSSEPDHLHSSLVVSSQDVQRLLDELGVGEAALDSVMCGSCDDGAGCEQACGCEHGCGRGKVADQTVKREVNVESLPLPIPLHLPVKLERIPSSSSAATADADLPEPPSPSSTPSPPSSLCLPPTLADLPLPPPLPEVPQPPSPDASPHDSPYRSASPAEPCYANMEHTTMEHTSMVPCALEATMMAHLPGRLAELLPELLPGLLPGTSAEMVCGSSECPLSRYGAHTHKTVAQLPPVGSAERQYLEEYVDRCFSSMTRSLGQEAALGQAHVSHAVPCA